MDYLVFRIYGPLASWGEAAVGPTRPTATYPGRSAVLGLLGAALGIRRDDNDALADLREAVGVAVKQFSPGVLVRDYHTAQVPGHDAKAIRLTRQDELSGPREKLHTILSSREYRCDGYWTAAITIREGGAWTLEHLADALRQPRFHLYLGRKSCPLAAPLEPRIVSAGGIREALAIEFPPLTALGHNEERRRLGIGAHVGYAWEGTAGDLSAQETRHPYDEPLDRGRWQFASRPEYWHQTREES